MGTGIHTPSAISFSLLHSLPMSTESASILKTYVSDNAAGVAPEILIEMAKVNADLVDPYGQDAVTKEVTNTFSDLFGKPVDLFPVATGSAANGLALSVMTPPWGAVICHPDGHIDNDEAGAPEFYTHGAKIITVEGNDSKIDPQALTEAVHRGEGSIHKVQPAVVSLTQATETGSVYTVDEITEICEIAHAAGLTVHMDGARFANAVASLGCDPADLVAKAGVDMLSFGATKNGAATVDAVISFHPEWHKDLAYRHKRAGQLISKMRFQSAQLRAYLHDDLWLRNAAQANAMAKRLRDGLADIAGLTIMGSPQANIVFCQIPVRVMDAMRADGFAFYDGLRGPGSIRLVTSFAHQSADIDAFIAAMKAHLSVYIHGE